MIEVENCRGGHHTRLKINLCVLGVLPSPVYKGGREEAAVLGGAPSIGSPSRIPFPIRSRREGKRGRRKGGLRPHPLSNSVWAGGRRAQPLGPYPFSPLKPNKAHYFSRRIPVTPRYSENTRITRNLFDIRI